MRPRSIRPESVWPKVVRPKAVRHLIVTADDFGLDPAINEAVELAHTQGILSAASLMVGQPAAGDAIARAKRLPGLRVGLHVTLTGGALPLLGPERIPELVDRQGRLPARLAAFGVKLAASAALRRQAWAEIRAQFEAFAATGLTLDHANAHQHFHQHPFVLEAMIRIGRDFGLRAVRVPHEPLWLARAVDATAPGAGRLEAAAWALGTGWMRRRLRAAGLECNDYLFGLRSSGRTDEAALCQALGALRPGVAEIYLHPASRADAPQRAAGVGARAPAELAGLIGGAARAQLHALGFTLGGFGDINRSGAGALVGASR